MRPLGRLVVSLGAVMALLASATFAQQGGNGILFGGILNTLLTNKDVHQELKVTPEQAGKLEKLAVDERAKNQRLGSELEAAPPEKARQKQDEIIKAACEETRKALAEILTPDQMKRFEQLRLQMNLVGNPTFAGSLAEPDVQDKLKLASVQRDKIKTIYAEFRSRMREAGRPPAANDREAALKHQNGIRKEIRDQLMAILSAEQKSTWEELIGAPFEVKP